MKNKKVTVDYLWTLLTQILVAISGIVLVVTISTIYSTESYGEYYLLKRVSDIVWLLSLLGLTVSIPRNSFFLGKANKSSIEVVIMLVTPLSIVFFLLFSRVLSFLFLGDLHNKYYNIFIFLVLGMILYGITYAYYRSMLKFRISNIIQIITFCVIPIGSLLLSKDMNSFIEIYGISVFIVNLILFILSFLKNTSILFKIREFQSIFNDTKFVLKYGFNRLPGLFFAGLIFTLPVTILNWYGTPYEVGLISQLFQIISIINMPINSLGLLLLPNVSKMVAENKIYEVKMKTTQLIIKISVLVVPLSIAIIVLSKFILNAFNDNDVNYSDIYFGFILLGIIPMTYYNLLRNIIDAVDHRAFSTFIVITSMFGTVFFSPVVYFFTVNNTFLLVLILSFCNFLLLGLISLLVCKKLVLEK